jgi:hypothetical protein
LDAQRASIVIQSYRAGELTGAEVSEEEQGTAATLGQE